MKYSLKIGWLYPDLMSIYGDRGNIICLQKRCEWRGITSAITLIGLDSTEKELRSCDLLFMGGAQDSQQIIVADDLIKKKKVLSSMIEDGIPGLYICGAFQFLGKYYKEADGTIVKGLGIFDLYTKNPGPTYPRLIGNMLFDASGILENNNSPMVGFENHGGRTYLGLGVKPLGKVIKGFGNNGEDGTEGSVYKNSLGTYSHGPILPKNPKIADWMIKTALEKKYAQKIELSLLNDIIADKAKQAITQKIMGK